MQKAIERYGREPEDEEIRGSVILRFETSYELCWKALSKELKQVNHSPSQIKNFDYEDNA